METEVLEKKTVAQLSDAEIAQIMLERKNRKSNDRKAYKDLVEETVPFAFWELSKLSEQMSHVKMLVFQKFEHILTLKAEVFGFKEKQMSHTFTAPTCEITIGYRINDGWDDTATVGVEKVKNALQRLAKDAESALLVEGIFDLLKKDAKGNLKGSRVLELQKFAEKIQDPELHDGVDIISKAYKPVRSSWFIEAYTVKEDGKKINVPLSLSAADFPDGYSFDFFNSETKQEDGKS